MLKNEFTRNKVSIASIILVALILIAIVIWKFNQRINRMENSVEDHPSTEKIKK